MLSCPAPSPSDNLSSGHEELLEQLESCPLLRHLQELFSSCPPKHASNTDNERRGGLESHNYVRLRQEGYQESEDSLG